MSCIPTGYGNPRFPGQLGGYGLRYPEEAAAWTPADLGADLLSAWDIWDATKVTLNGGDVSAVADTKSVESLVQASASNQPTLQAEYWNSEDAAQFNRSETDRIVAAANSSYNTPGTLGLFFVGIPRAYTSNAPMATHVLSSDYIYLNVVSTNTVRAVINGTNINYSLPSGVWTIPPAQPLAMFAQLKADGTRELYVNGSLVGAVAGAAPSGGTHAGTSIGAFYTGSTPSAVTASHLAVTKELDSTQIADYMSWAATKFGIT